jgi:hypothetical protein
LSKKQKKIDSKLWMHGVCHLSVVPIWGRPDDDTHMVSQLLFGEVCTIIEKKNKHWHRINTQDDVMGWVRAIQYTIIDEKSYSKLISSSGLALEIAHPIIRDENAVTVLLGSFLPNFDGIACFMPDGNYVYNGLAKQNGSEISMDNFVKVLRRFLNSPELRGGKTPFGIDAPALVQLAFRYLNIDLPRYTYNQAQLGQVVDFVELVQRGDLIFCQNNDGTINHVAIYIGDRKVIHVYGCVRIDKLDHHGIYNTSLHKYTHSLRIIKRILPQLDDEIASK